MFHFTENCQNGYAKLDVDGIPYLFWDGKWSPICGHNFWDNQNGAKAFCQELGFNGGKFHRQSGRYSEDAIEVGTCRSGETIDSCTGGFNKYKTTERCKAGNGVKITISCDDHIPGTEVESCLGIFSAKNIYSYEKSNLIFAN